MIYNALKLIHIISAAIVLTTNGCIGLLLKKNLHNTSNRLALFKKTGLLSPLITLPFGILQAGSGFAMVSQHAIPITLPWLYLPLLCFLGAAGLWCVIFFVHWQCVAALEHQQWDVFHRLFRQAFALGILALSCIQIAVFCMANLSLHYIV